MRRPAVTWGAGRLCWIAGIGIFAILGGCAGSRSSKSSAPGEASPAGLMDQSVATSTPSSDVPGGGDPNEFARQMQTVAPIAPGVPARKRMNGDPYAGEALTMGSQEQRSYQRKIIYTAELTLVVPRLEPVREKLLSLVRSARGYVANSSVSGSAGETRSAHWTLRVPVSAYGKFLSDVATLGEVQTQSSDSQDVSEEFYDVEARLRNGRAAESRLLEHLKRSAARLSDILSVERELTRVRGEIEQMEGRIRFLRNQTDLTTVTITINEAREYVPQSHTSFSARLGRTWTSALESVRDAGAGIVLGLVFAAPWIVIWGIVLFILYRAIRSWIGRRKAAGSAMSEGTSTPPSQS